MSGHELIKNADSPLYKLIVFRRDQDAMAHFNPKHWHNHLEVTCCLSGRTHLWLDGKDYTYSGGHAYIINPRSVHTVQGLSPFSENSGLCLQIDLRVLSRIIPGADTFLFDSECSDELSMRIISLLDQLREDTENNASMIIRTSKVLAVFNLLNEHMRAGSPLSNNDSTLMPILEYIKSHYREDITTGDIAAHCGLSVTHLNRVFRAGMNQSVHSYITDLRIKSAADDIRDTDLSLTDIYLHNGFPNNKSFIDGFKKHFEMTPSQYKKQLAKRKSHA